MSAWLMALQATAVEALPEDAAATVQAAADTAADPGNNSLNMLQLILHASLPVQLVMVLLLFASIASWVIIFRKKRVLDRAQKEADQFEERFWSGAELAKLYSAATERNRDIGGLEAIFEGGFREFNRNRQRRNVDARTQLEGAQRSMRATASRELDGLEHNLEFLANVGSISPYVGLFGTVWGIMTSFQSIAASKNTSLAVVAPGIAEALFATAIGLVAAIPATIFYNKFVAEVNKQAQRLEGFADEFAAILSRQIDESA